MNIASSPTSLRPYLSETSAQLALQLAPSARYYICKLLRQSGENESVELSAFRVKLAEDHYTHLNQRLCQLYPDAAELTKVLLRLENLVHLNQSLTTQFSLYSDYTRQASEIKLEIFHLLGFA